MRKERKKEDVSTSLRVSKGSDYEEVTIESVVPSIEHLQILKCKRKRERGKDV